MTSLPLASLVEDYSIYPRHAVDDANVSSLVNALKAGATLPPIVIDRRSRRISDGWHRVRAYKRVLGPEGVVTVEEIDYGDDVEMLKDAIRRNASHGRKLDMIDQVRSVELCRERGVDASIIAEILHIPPERVKKLEVRIARVEKSGAGVIPGTLTVALKRSAGHFAGREMTAEQLEAHNGAPGVSYLLIARQLTEGIRAGLLNRADDKLLESLRELAEVLEELFEEE